MRKNSDLICWARTWHWPQLVLSETGKEYIPAGEAAWRAFAGRPNRKAKQQAWQRIRRWDALAEAVEAQQTA
jgi:hypothetical protein